VEWKKMVKFQKFLHKVVTGGDHRLTRFHTEDNKFIGLKSLLKEVPVVILQKSLNSLRGQRPVRPWWPLEAISAVNSELNKEMSVLEFGSGSSTLWLALRVKNVVSREHNEEWADITRARALEVNLKNCEVQHRVGDQYYHLNDFDSYDVAIVDGEYRWKCLESLANKIRAGGFIYFDNSDSDKDAHHYAEFGLEVPHQAQLLIEELKKQRKVRIKEIHGMIDGELFAGSGILIFFDT
jgi:protein-L-isoaspartate O-methyltransferase